MLTSDPLILLHNLQYYTPSLVLQHIPVPGLSIDHIDDRLVRLLHATLLDPWLDLLVSRKLQHLRNLIWRSDRRTTNLDTTSDECESVDSRQVTTVRSAEESLAIVQKPNVR
jgi:hypothetical protein